MRISRLKLVTLYLPFEEYFTWAEMPDVAISQHEDRQAVYDLVMLACRKTTPEQRIMVGFHNLSGYRPINRIQAEREAVAKRVAEMEPELGKIVTSYLDEEQAVREQEQIAEQAQQKYRELSEKKRGWIKALLEPIAEMLVKEPELKGCTYEILGPFGVGAHTQLWFRRPGALPRSPGEFIPPDFSLTVAPGDLHVGELDIVDERTNTHRFAEGTIGEMNGGNHPLIPMPNTVRGIIDFMFKQKEEKQQALNLGSTPST